MAKRCRLPAIRRCSAWLEPITAGNGTTNFGVPNLLGLATVGANNGPGVASGSPSVALTVPQLPPLAWRSGQPFRNLQLSLTLTPLIAISGPFPSMSTTNGPAFVGQIAYYAGSLGPGDEFLPNGWAVADGSVLTFANNSALGSVIGDQFGGKWDTTFALPDLIGGLAVGASASRPIGTQFGEASTTLTSSELPPTSAPVTNDQPSLSVNSSDCDPRNFPASGPARLGHLATALRDPGRRDCRIRRQLRARRRGVRRRGCAFGHIKRSLVQRHRHEHTSPVDRAPSTCRTSMDER